MDYIIADKIVIQEGEEKYYTEKVKYLPRSLIPSSNNIKQKTKNKKFVRSEFGLPEKKNSILCFS